MIDFQNDDRIAQINPKEILRIKVTPDGFIIPIVDNSGLKININLETAQAHFLSAYLQMAICSQVTSIGPQNSEIPKAPTVVKVHEWSMGIKESNKDIILRFKNPEHIFFDFEMDRSAASQISNDIKVFMSKY